MNTDYIRTLYDYNAWANERILETTAQLSPDQFLRQARTSFDSVRDTLVHTLSAHWIWLSRWQGVSPRAMFNPGDYPTLESIRSRWTQIERETHAFVADLDDRKLDSIIEYIRTEGLPSAYPLWQLMVHQVNHATQHRSEVAALLTQFGHSPGDLDLIVYLYLQKEMAANQVKE
jgi:uncharacterized damage-inducible protein DinB